MQISNISLGILFITVFIATAFATAFIIASSDIAYAESVRIYSKQSEILRNGPAGIAIGTVVASTNSELTTNTTIKSTASEILEKATTMDEIWEHDGIKYVKGEDLGSFKLTGYCACSKCSSGTGITYSGKYVRPNHTVAADLNILPLGTMIILDSTNDDETDLYSGVYQVEDKGGGVKNKHIDIYQPSHDLAALVTYTGYKYAHVYIAMPLE